MQITVEIPESKAPFVMELFRSLSFIKIKPQMDSFANFKEEWASLSASLPQSEPDMSYEEIMEEVRAVRKERDQRKEMATE